MQRCSRIHLLAILIVALDVRLASSNNEGKCISASEKL